MDFPFTFAGYGALIEALLARGYGVRGFADARPAHPDLILRHDVDQSLESAARLAAFEAERGWRASYFVLVRSEMYNPFSPASTRALGAIAAGGHAIGLHLDAALYGADETALEAATARECAVLEAIARRPVAMVSFHRPAPGLIPCARALAGRPNTYERRFVEDIGYCSDSRGGWHRGAPLDHPAVAEGRALQLLTHAIWWDGEAGESARERLDRLVAARERSFRRELAAHNAVYAEGEER